MGGEILVLLGGLFPLAGFFTAKNPPDVLSRFFQAVAPPNSILTCERFLTAPCAHCRRPVC
jgi:hypothetical protein